MSVRIDPEGREIAALQALTGPLAEKRVLEIGCGDGRLTWRYASQAASVLAIDPDRTAIAVAREDLPAALRTRVELRATGIEELYVPGRRFDVAILAWAL